MAAEVPHPHGGEDDPGLPRSVPSPRTSRRGRGLAGADPRSTASASAEHRVVCHLDVLLADRGMTLKELSERVGVTVVNLSVLKNDRAKAIRFTTLTAICDALGCQPGELFSVQPADG